MLRGKRFRRILKGVYILTEIPHSEGLVARAALLRLPSEAVLSHLSAALVYRLPVPAGLGAHVTLDDPAGSHRLAGVQIHRRHVPSEAVTQRQNLPVTTAVRTFLDLAECLPLVELVVVGDAIVRSRLASVERLRAAAAGMRGRHCRLARRAAALVRDLVDSPMETRVRLMIVFAGLPEPRIAQNVFDDSGGWIARLDLSYPDAKVAIEYDGSQHLTNRRQWTSDLMRRELLDRAGWRVIVLTAQDYYRRPDHTLGRIEAVLIERNVLSPDQAASGAERAG